MNVSKPAKIIIIFIVVLLSLFALKYTYRTSNEASLGYVVSERCKQKAHKYLSGWKDHGIDISYLEINNSKGSINAFFKEYVSLKSTKFDKEFLEGVMNGSLSKCSRDGIIESKIDDKYLLSDLKNYVKVLKQKGVKGSLIVEIKGSDVLIHENSLHTLDMMRSHEQ